jgi:uncharacterized Ntn-hydrolase superfamily protein
MKKYLFFFLLGLLSSNNAQNYYGSEPFAHTYSIVAIDTSTGEMGVAVQSHWYSVGTIVSWGEAGVGVVATQSFVNPSFGPKGLELLKEGLTAEQVLDIMIENDNGRNVRQLAILDAGGKVAAFTGEDCIDFAGHVVGQNYSVQANMMLNETVPNAMAKSFENSSGSLEDRLMLALEAAESEGGDIRGKQSAALLVVKSESTGQVWLDRKVDIRVDDHPEPLKELRRILKVHKAYEHMNKGDLAIEYNDMDLAMKEYSAAEELFPDNEEMKFWHAVTLASIGQVDESLPLFKEVFKKNINWNKLVPRLVKSKLLEVDEETLFKILSQAE